jgi:hypothetical protein
MWDNDITKCKGEGCELRETCYRYKAKPSRWQSYGAFEAVRDKDGKCGYYWRYDDGYETSGTGTTKTV